MLRKSSELALAGLSAIAVAYGFARYSYGLFVPTLREEFGLTTGTLGIISSASYAAYLLAMILTGFLAAKTGPRFPVVTGAVCAGVGMIIVAIAQDPIALAVGVVLAGSSPGFVLAPFSDAVAMLVEEERQGRVLSVISTGTSFGLVVAGPVVLLTATDDGKDGSAWRYAWIAFATAALLVALWNATLLPKTPHQLPSSDESDKDAGKVSISWFICPRSGPLLGHAFVYGLIAAFYYTYAVELVQRLGFGEVWGPIMWSLVGVAGIAGVLSSDAVSQFGLKRCLATCLGMLAIAIGTLGSTGDSAFLLSLCAVVFGASYMPIGALLVVWSSNVFRERPATGFSAVLFSLALGSTVGPILLGTVAVTFDLRTAFWCAAALTATSIILRPKSDIRGTAPRTSADSPTVATGKIDAP